MARRVINTTELRVVFYVHLIDHLLCVCGVTTGGSRAWHDARPEPHTACGPPV